MISTSVKLFYLLLDVYNYCLKYFSKEIEIEQKYNCSISVVF